MADFKSRYDYSDFERKVLRESRYAFDSEAQEFLDTVVSTINSDRTFLLEDPSYLYRAQRGYRLEKRLAEEGEFESEIPYGFERMKPLANSAREGRVNAKGIPCLYLSDDKNTAMAETRPWIGSFISLGLFVTLRPLNLVNCVSSLSNRRFALTPDGFLTPEQKEQITWRQIASSFSQPVEPTESTAEYAPTQILSDFFRHHGYDGIRYKSLLGKGNNFAIFDLNAADLCRCELRRVENVQFDFSSEVSSYANPKRQLEQVE